MSALLTVSQLSVAYGGIQAVRDLSLEVASGEMVCLIGANGAGKTTTLKAISGLIAPKAGGVAVLLIEQNAHLALKTCARGYVLENGAISLSGQARDLAANPAVRHAYMGE